MAPLWAGGAKALVICRACQGIGPTAHDRAGPVLNRGSRRDAGSQPGYAYSAPDRTPRIRWGVAMLEKHLASRQTRLQHAEMVSAGLNNQAKLKVAIARPEQYAPERREIQSATPKEPDLPSLLHPMGRHRCRRGTKGKCSRGA